MLQTDQTITMTLLFFIPFSLVGAFLMGSQWKRYTLYKDETPTVARGKVISNRRKISHSSKGVSVSYVPTYQFKYKGKIQTIESEYGRSPQTKIGKEADIYIYHDTIHIGKIKLWNSIFIIGILFIISGILTAFIMLSGI